MDKIKLGWCVCGSFCTFDAVIAQMERVSRLHYHIIPIMSEFAYATNTRFGKAREYISKIETICGRTVIHTIEEAEPVGPGKLFDILLIAPCTGNTIGKLANGITDTAVTMAAKAHLRNCRPLVIALSSNDALSASAKNIGLLMNGKNIYFVPMTQDDTTAKPNSLAATFELIPETLTAALSGTQLQPVLM